MQTLPLDHQKQLDEMPSYYWWHRHRIRMVHRLVRRFAERPPQPDWRYLDIGSGSGATAHQVALQLQADGFLRVCPEQLYCLEGDPALAEIQRTKPATFIPADLESGRLPALPPMHLFAAMDVLEHLRHPVSLLRALRPSLADGAVGVITVPAFQHLFSAWDRRLHHHRRYTRGSLAQEIVSAGYQVVWASYLFSFLYLPAWIKRGVLSENVLEGSSEFPSVPLWMNSALLQAARVEEAMTRLCGVPFGTSVIMVVRA